MTWNHIRVTSLSRCVTKIVMLHRMSKIDIQPDFWNHQMLSFEALFGQTTSQVPQLTWKSVGCTIPKKHGTAADLPLRFWSLDAKDLFNFPTGFLIKWHLGGGSGKSAADVEWLYLCTQWMNRSEAKAKSLAETLTYPIFIAFSQCVTKWKLWKGPK